MIAERKKILIVDDEEDFCSFLKTNLQDAAGYEVLVAGTCEEGLRLATEARPDLILLDLILPGMDGLELLRQLRRDERTRGISVMIISVKSDDQTKRQGQALAIKGYLEKPIEMKDLLSGIQKALGSRRKGLLERLRPSPRKTRVLIMDDEEDFAHFVKANLEDLGGYEVKVASRPQAGLRLAEEWRPDLVLLDIIMPGMDGLEVLRRLKEGERTRAISVLMLSARTDEMAKRESTRMYIEGYVEKPVEVEALRDKIDKVLSRFGRREGKRETFPSA